MRSSIGIGIIAVTAAATGFVGCSKTDTATTGSTAAPTSASTTAGAPTTASTGTTAKTGGAATPSANAAGTVTVKTFQFKPTPITVKAGSPVTWLNEDDITHEPTSGEPGKITDAFKTVTLDGKGATGAATIAKPGTYKYFCSFHESMVGEIVVT